MQHRVTSASAALHVCSLQERLGVAFEKGDEMDCLVRGCNFLLTQVPREAFTFRKGQPTYIDKGALLLLFPRAPLHAACCADELP